MLDFLSLFIKVNFEKLLCQNKCCVFFWKVTGPKLNVMSKGEINEKNCWGSTNQNSLHDHRTRRKHSQTTKINNELESGTWSMAMAMTTLLFIGLLFTFLLVNVCEGWSVGGGGNIHRYPTVRQRSKV